MQATTKRISVSSALYSTAVAATVTSLTIVTIAAVIILGGANLAAAQNCGQPVSSGAQPTSTDARYILLAAIGARVSDPCLCDVDDSGDTTAVDALIALHAAVELPAVLACPACDSSAQCPGVAQFVLFAKIRGACTVDAECGAIAICDQSIGRCRTVTDLDIGWTGLSHQSDLDDIVPARLELDCQGPAPCGECTILRLDPQLGNCRCASDNQAVCFHPHESDDVSCGGDICECYFGPPVPLSSGNVPTCLVNRLDAEPSGLVNVDQGSGTIEIPLREEVYTGINNFSPCPFCDGDPFPADGVRGGVCSGGRNDGMSCDAQSANSSFTAPGGARYSIDCFPDTGRNISGAGLLVDLPLTTDMTILPAQTVCGFGDLLTCPCQVCSSDFSVDCSSDAECAAIGAGTCSASGPGSSVLPNACVDGVCADIGAGRGQCNAGPDDRFCDGITRADGRGFIGCLTNVDCDPASIGTDAGDCSLVERRPCFLDPIVASGTAHPVLPTAATVTCTSPTSSASINAAAGLPGPTRWTQQSQLTLFCTSSPLDIYTPGVGGCPE